MMRETHMRGYFGIGVERASKPMNLGNLYRTAHGFGASFLFTIGADAHMRVPESGLPHGSDTSKAAENLPLFHYDALDDLNLPQGCQLIGIELTEDATELPSFHHPHNAAYILGSEIYGLSPDTLARCRFVIKIPTKFSLNLATAGAIVMYDRLRCLGRFPERHMPMGGPDRANRRQKSPDAENDRPRVRKDLLRREQARVTASGTASKPSKE